MRSLFVIACLFIGTAQAGNMTYLNEKGSDLNDCLSPNLPSPPGAASGACKTLQRGADVAGGAGFDVTAKVNLAPGTYQSSALITFTRYVTFQGDCSNPVGALVTAPNGIAFNAQNWAVIVVKCLNIYAENGVALSSRQFSVIDYQNVIFGPANIHVSANEMSKINCQGARVIANAAVHLMANGLSTISAGCDMTIDSGVAFSAYYAGAFGRALISGGGGTFSGKGTQSGPQYANDASMITQPSGGFPGNGSANTCANGCVVE